MNRKLISLLVASLCGTNAAAAADDPFTWSGSVGVGARIVDTDGANRSGARATSATTTTPFIGPEDAAKASEYKDLANGLIGNIDLQGSNSRYYTRFFGENFGRDDQYLNLRGGQYGMFTYRAYEEKMPHNRRGAVDGTWRRLSSRPESGNLEHVQLRVAA
jgi:hypothetical protein